MAEENMIGRFSSFFEMTSSLDPRYKFDLITIPKIQRDYAQGRPGKESLRENFLSALFNAIDSEEGERIELDFIYGKKDPKERIFLPIDGQQRLTTLFLLHLYLAKRCGADAGLLEPFTYEVRQSSKDFIKKLLDINPEYFVGLTEYIRKQWWFNSRWKNDPTISSMLVVLAAIDAHYSSFKTAEILKVWKRLTEEGRIGFWLLNLEDLDTTDDLYIKMNSRGRQLTDFEHFKAQIEGRLNQARNKGVEVSADFSRKIDTDWTTLLWNYRDNLDSDPEKYFSNGLDDRFRNLFRNFMIIEGTKAGIEIQISDEEKRILGTEDLRKMNILKLAETVLDYDISLIDRFSKILDFFYINSRKKPVSNFFREVVTAIPYEELKDEKKENNFRVYLPSCVENNLDFLATALENRVTNINFLYIETFFEYAYLNDVINSEFGSLRNSVRVIRNLIENSPDSIRQENMPTLLKRVDALVKNCKDLDPEEKNSFLQVQIRQEILKFEWMEQHSSDRLPIMFIENHSFLLGDISAYIEDNIVFADSLKAHATFFIPEVSDQLDAVERLLLTFGDYGAEVGWKRLYGGYIWENWGDDIFARADKHSGKILRDMLNVFPVFDEVKAEEHIEKWMKKCEEGNVFRWRYYLIKYPELRDIEAARYQKLRWENNRYNWQMLNSPSRRGWYQSAFLWVLHCILEDRRKNSSEIRSKGDPLYIKRLKWTVYQTETGFRIEYSKDRQRRAYLLDIPQSPKGIDLDDRVQFFLQFYERAVKE
ncbi:MAG: DUF262 domain-containing protein [Muribaculaceae bacterium]|nr:DUF262 domain-containing protein [Muribaculaceae bacterium]